MTEFTRLAVREFEGGTVASELDDWKTSGPNIALVTEDGKRLVATMRDFGFDGGDETRIRAEAHRLVECWNNSLQPKK